jgi:hypothetical protein
MAILDNLEILITADSRGVENVLKSTLQTVLGTVNQINSQEVDWTSIFTSAISPTMIVAVATMFALAISNAVDFNAAANNLNNLNTTGVDSMNNSLTNTASLAESSGLMLGDTSSAFNSFSSAGLDAAAAALATSDAAGIARDTGESLSTVVSNLATLFNQWGVTTSSGVTSALTGLVNASQNGEFNFDELTSAISDKGPFLKTQTNISDTAVSLASLSLKSGLSKSTILDSFSAIAEGATSNFSPMSVLVGNVSNAITSGPEGLITAFGNIEKYVQKVGPSIAQSTLQTTGLMSKDIADLSSSSVTNMDASADSAKKLNGSLKPVEEDLADHEPVMAKLVGDWNSFKDALSATVMPNISGAIDAIQASLHTLVNSSEWKSVEDFMTHTQPGQSMNFENSGLSKAATEAQLLGRALTDPKLYNLGQTLSGQGNNGLPQGAAFDPEQVLQIENQANSSNQIDQIVDALKNGINSGSSTYNNMSLSLGLHKYSTSQNLSASDFAQLLYTAYQGL